MSHFKKLFGIEETAVKKGVILLPFLNKKIKKTLGISNPAKGFSYSSFSAENYTVIYTGIGATFVGDAVLYLKQTPCEQIILFGACGSLSKNYDIGELLIIKKCLQAESFSDALDPDFSRLSAYAPSKHLINTATAINNARSVQCISFGSLALEPSYKEQLLALGADVIDMECSSLYSAALKTNKEALALLYVTDHIGDKPFFRKLGNADQNKLNTAIEKGVMQIKRLLNV